MFDPERGVEKRIVLLSSPEVEPDSGETAEGLKVGASDVTAVIPKQGAMQGRPIREQCEGENAECGSEATRAQGELGLVWSGSRFSRGCGPLLGMSAISLPGRTRQVSGSQAS